MTKTSWSLSIWMYIDRTRGGNNNRQLFLWSFGRVSRGISLRFDYQKKAKMEGAEFLVVLRAKQCAF